MVIIDYLRALLFDYRKRKAIRLAQTSAELYKRKYLVMVCNGKPTCVSMQTIRKLIKQRRFVKGFTPEKARAIALYEANPPK